MDAIRARKTSSHIIVSKGPDVCWTPRGNTMVKVAYSSISFLNTAVRCSKSVRNNGDYDFQLNSRCSTSEGHEPGIGKGIKVAGYKGPSHANRAHALIYSEGFALVSHRDPAWINKDTKGSQEPQKTIFKKEL